MESIRRWLATVPLFVLWIGAAQAATVELNDGSKFTGTVTDDGAGNVTVKLKKGSISFKKDEIKSIVNDDAAAAPAAPAEAPKPEASVPKPEPAPKPEAKPAIPKPPPATVETKPAPKPEPAEQPAPPVTAAGTNAGLAGRNAHEDNEPRDILVLKGGGEQRGFLVSETEGEIVFDCIMSGKNVSKTIMSRTTFQRAEVESVKKLTDEERAAAKKSLASVAAQEKKDAHAEKNVDIVSAIWYTQEGHKPVPVSAVNFEHFNIESDVGDELLGKIAFRLNKVFTAYQNHFGADRNLGSKVTVKVFKSMAEYYASIGDGMKNPAFYTPDLKMICAGCDVPFYERLVAEIKVLLKQRDAELQEWKVKANMAREEVRDKVRRAFDQIDAAGQGNTPEGRAAKDRIHQQETEWMLDVGAKEKHVNEIQNEIFSLNRRLDVAFNELTQYMLAMMYHEGFHAFLDNFLFTQEQVKLVPRWLNEGLAQYFEAARLENNKFVLGQDVKEKMALLRQFKKEDALLPLEKLVNGGQNDYLVHDMSNLKTSAKNYYQGWLLTNYLGEKGRLTRETLSAYIAELAKKTPPLDALPVLSGMPNDKLEQALIDKLQTTFQATDK
jgi:hypothetical protein